MAAKRIKKKPKTERNDRSEKELTPEQKRLLAEYLRTHPMARVRR